MRLPAGRLLRSARALRLLAAALPLAAAGAAAGDAGSAAECPQHGVCVVESRTRYALDAHSVRHLQKSVREGGLPHPRGRAHALSDFDLVVAYTPVDSGGHCLLRDLRLRLEVQLWLPEFTGAEDASPRTREQAAALGDALLHHEEGHVHIAMAHAHGLLAALHALPPAADCREARNAAARLQLRHSLRHELAQQRYDARTRYGAEQGAELERRVDRLPGLRFRRGTGPRL